MTLSFIGFEIVLFLYPFIKDPQRSKKWAHFAILTTTLLFTVFAIVTFAYFSEEQLQKALWPTLSMWKILKLSFVDRFEFIGIANWNLIILPNVCLSIWIGSRLVNRIFNIRQKKGVYLFIIPHLAAINFIHTREGIDLLNQSVAKIGFVFTMLYIPLLFIAVQIAKKVKTKWKDFFGFSLIITTIRMCWKKVIDDINIVIGIGFDHSRDKQILGTFLTQTYNADKSIGNQTFSSKAILRRDLLIKANRQSSQPLVTGGLGVTVVGEELGKRGMKDILDVYQRDVAIGARNFLQFRKEKLKIFYKENMEQREAEIIYTLFWIPILKLKIYLKRISICYYVIIIKQERIFTFLG